MIWILTLSNKPDYLPEAVASVEAQTRRDFRHVVEIDRGGWNGLYPPAVFYNRVVESIPLADYVAWLSDDDVLEPHYCETLAGYLDAHPEVGCCYGGSKCVTYDRETGEMKYHRDLPARSTFTGSRQPLCEIDGGQYMVRRSVLEQLSRPICPETLENCHINDGVLMNRIASVTPIVPVVDSWVMTNRSTPLSSHWRYVDGRMEHTTGDTVTRLRPMGGRNGMG